MNGRSPQTLRRVQENDDTLESLWIGGRRDFRSSVGDDYSRLGAAIGENTHLTKLNVVLDDIVSDVTNNAFYDGLKQNSSIQTLSLICHNFAVVGGVVEAIFVLEVSRK